MATETEPLTGLDKWALVARARAAFAPLTPEGEALLVELARRLGVRPRATHCVQCGRKIEAPAGARPYRSHRKHCSTSCRVMAYRARLAAAGKCVTCRQPKEGCGHDHGA